MKKIALIIFPILFPLVVLSQPCLNEGISFTNQAQIDSFQINYPGCTEIEGDVWIGGVNITNLNGISILSYIWGDLLINYNDSLTTLMGLDGLTSIEGDLLIARNNSLTNLVGLDILTSIGGELWIFHNYALTNLTGLEALTSVGALTIGMYPLMGGYNNLTSLTGLEGLTSIGNYLTILYNGYLISLTGLDNIDAASIVDLSIHRNGMLSTCEVQSICDYLSAPGGTINIHDNSSGCNSQAEVEEACETVSIDDVAIVREITTSPNPFTSSTILSYTLDKPSTVTLRIFNSQGQLIEKIEREQQKDKQQFQWNAEGLPAGMYYFRIQAGDMSGGGKIVKK